jgi:hypothetical protein
LWQVIGCRRGPLDTEILSLAFCPESASSSRHVVPSIAESDGVKRCLDEASMRRREATNGVELLFKGQKPRENNSLQKIAVGVVMSRGNGSKTSINNGSISWIGSTYGIVALVWEFLDNSFSMGILDNRCTIEGLSSILVAAATYKEELGDVGDMLCF